MRTSQWQTVFHATQQIIATEVQYLWKRHSSHLAVECYSHSFHDPVVFNGGVKAGLHSLIGCSSHHQLAILCDNLFVGNLHDVQFNLLDDSQLDGREVKLLQTGTISSPLKCTYFWEIIC